MVDPANYKFILRRYKIKKTFDLYKKVIKKFFVVKMNFGNYIILLATVPSLVKSASLETNPMYDDYDQFWKRVFASNE